MQARDQLLLNDTSKIGIVGGLSFRAGVFYYEKILKRSSQENKSLRLLLNHAEIKTVLAHVAAGNVVELGKYLGGLANELFDAGAEHVSITAVAPHLAIEEIKRVARGPIISALDSLVSTATANGIQRVAVFGNRTTMATGIFGALPDDMVVQLGLEEQEKVHDMYTEIATLGKQGTSPEAEYFNKLAGRMVSQQGADAIVLAGTDLSSFYAEQPPEYPHLDIANIHINQILEYC